MTYHQIRYSGVNILNEYFVRLYQMNSNIIDVRSKLGSQRLSCTLKLSNFVIFPTETPIRGKRFDTIIKKTRGCQAPMQFCRHHFFKSSNIFTRNPHYRKAFRKNNSKRRGCQGSRYFCRHHFFKSNDISIRNPHYREAFRKRNSKQRGCQGSIFRCFCFAPYRNHL